MSRTRRTFVRTAGLAAVAFAMLLGPMAGGASAALPSSPDGVVYSDAGTVLTKSGTNCYTAAAAPSSPRKLLFANCYRIQGMRLLNGRLGVAVVATDASCWTRQIGRTGWVREFAASTKCRRINLGRVNGGQPGQYNVAIAETANGTAGASRIWLRHVDGGDTRWHEDLPRPAAR